MSRFFTIAVVALFVAQAALAVDYTFTGTAPGTDLWQTPAVWGGAGFPNSLTDTAYFSGAIAQTARTDNGGPYKVGNVTLGSGTGTGIINIGNFAGGLGLEIAAGATITKKDTSADRIYSKLTLDGNTTFNCTTGTTGSLYVYNLDGPGGVTKTGTGWMYMEGNVGNTYAGLTTVSGGRLYLSGTAGTQWIPSGGLKLAGRLQYNSPGNGDHIADNCPVELAANGEIVANSNAETVGVATLTGNCTLWGSAADLGFHFANSSAAVWTPGAKITLTTYGKLVSVVAPKYYFGTDSTGLTASQLAQIQFVDEDASGNLGTAYAAMFDPAHPGLLIAQTHVTTYWASDFNHDLVVNFKDYIILEGNFSKSNATNAMGDADGDGFVTFKDYIVLEGQFNKTSTPEPATIGLLIAGGLALLRRKAA